MRCVVPCTIIAEAGVNHNGSAEMAHKLVDVAVDCGVDVVKFQTFRTEKLVTRNANRAKYQQRNMQETGSQFSMLKALELEPRDYRELAARCRTKGVEFLSTPFDIESLQFLVENKLIERIKVASGELTNLPFLLEIARTGMPIILSTGMSTLAEIEMALGVLAFGLAAPRTAPSLQEFGRAYCSDQGQELLRQKVSILQCTTEYPAPPKSIHLRVMDTLTQAFGLPVGFSDHSAGIHIPVAAVARGATILEKHYTLDRSLPGPDHKASLEPAELRNMVTAIREVEMALGHGKKYPSPEEVDNRLIARKVIVASLPIAVGQTFSAENIEIKRGTGGLSSDRYWEILGRTSQRAFDVDEPISFEETRA